MTHKIRATRLRQLEGQLGEVAYQITKVHFVSLRRPAVAWRPAINFFECASCIRICVELAGVARENIELEAYPGRLIVRGSRTPPEPASKGSSHPGSVRVVTMEIDYGPFEREINLPRDIYLERITTDWDDAMLWIFIPRRPQA